MGKRWSHRRWQVTRQSHPVGADLRLRGVASSIPSGATCLPPRGAIRTDSTKVEHVFDKLLPMPITTTEARIRRKTNHLATARSCGERLARINDSETDPVGFLANLDARVLTRREEAARSGLLPATWLGAFARGWRTARN